MSAYLNPRYRVHGFTRAFERLNRGGQLMHNGGCSLATAGELASWEERFEREWDRVQLADRARAGALLPIVPNLAEWNRFLEVVRAAWCTWLRGLGENPHCLAVLYGGLAFYEYQDRALWPQFATSLQRPPFSPNEQTQINATFSTAVSRLGLGTKRREGSADWVGTAIYHIGIPLSLWEGFLDVCEWALWRTDWEALDDADWRDAISGRTGGLTRLKTFLYENREAASVKIQEMLGARKVLTEDDSLTIDDIKQVCFLRSEYFDYVPETADFLRPANPASLLEHSPRLVWDEQRWRLSLHVPGVSGLPARWRIATVIQQAAPTPHEILLNSAALKSALRVRLEQPNVAQEWDLPGVEPWGLFDLSDGRAVNSKREQLRVRAYDHICHQPLTCVQREGFDEQEYPANEPLELEDGTPCYRTRLIPTRRSARLSFAQAGRTQELQFRETAKIEARVYSGEGQFAAGFRWSEGRMKLDHLPLICVGIPFGYFRDVESVLQQKLQVFLDGTSVSGAWQKFYEDGHRQFYRWRWAYDQVCTLSPGAFEAQFKGKRTLTVEAPELGLSIEERKLEIENPKVGMGECWKNLPGSYLPWFVLCQKREGMKRSDIVHAENAIAPGQEVRYDVLRQYASLGFLRQKGHTWAIVESRAALNKLPSGNWEVLFCGNPCTLWGLFRRMHDLHRGSQLPLVEVVRNKGYPPFLLMCWEARFQPDLHKYLKTHGVHIIPDLFRRS